MTTVLVTVPDEGAAAAVCEALAEAALPAEVRRSYRQHPYQPSPLATPFEIIVDDADLEAARGVLQRLAEENVAELASSSEDTEGQRPWEQQRWWRRPSPWIAVVVALVPIVPLACFYAGARRMGAVFAGVTLAAFCLMFGQGGAFSLGAVSSPYPSAWHGWLRPRDPAERAQGQRPSQTPLEELPRADRLSLGLGRTLTAAKLGDLAVALWFIRRERRRARGYFSTNARSMT